MLPDKVLVSIETYSCFIDFVTQSSANGDVNLFKAAPFAMYTLSEQSSLTQSSGEAAQSEWHPELH